jgi:hypothetical protein
LERLAVRREFLMSFMEYTQWRQRWPDALDMLTVLGISLVDPSPGQFRRWMNASKGKHIRRTNLGRPLRPPIDPPFLDAKI